MFASVSKKELLLREPASLLPLLLQKLLSYSPFSDDS
jgi:hypothetical protein